VRLVLEEAGAAYVDVGRQPRSRGGGVEAVVAFYAGKHEGHPVFAPPVLKQGGACERRVRQLLEECGRHLRTAGVVDAGEDHGVHGASFPSQWRNPVASG
jgi:glutathione S-transferase